LYRVDPPNDEQQACSKHAEGYYWNKLIENSASCWLMLYGLRVMFGVTAEIPFQNIDMKTGTYTE